MHRGLSHAFIGLELLVVLLLGSYVFMGSLCDELNQPKYMIILLLIFHQILLDHLVHHFSRSVQILLRSASDKLYQRGRLRLSVLAQVLGGLSHLFGNLRELVHILLVQLLLDGVLQREGGPLA